MKEIRSPVGEDDLQAHVDGRVSGERLALVEAYLDEHPDTRARIERERQYTEALRQQLRRKYDEPIPARLRIANIRAGLRRRTMERMRAAAAAVVIFLLGCGSGWVLGSRPGALLERTELASTSAISRDARDAYLTYAVEVAHPVEVGSDNEAHLMAWLSKRLGRPLSAPDLAAFGYTLMGGRLLPGGESAAGQLMYENAAGERLTLYIKAADGTETAFHFFQEGDVSTFAWMDQGFGFAVTAPLVRTRLLPIAQAVYHGF